MKRVIRSDKPVTVLLLFWSHQCDIGAEPRRRIIATSAVEGLITLKTCSVQQRNYPSLFILIGTFELVHPSQLRASGMQHQTQ
jgi:hypothetical protein